MLESPSRGAFADWMAFSEYLAGIERALQSGFQNEARMETGQARTPKGRV